MWKLSCDNFKDYLRRKKGMTLTLLVLCGSSDKISESFSLKKHKIKKRKVPR